MVGSVVPRVFKSAWFARAARKVRITDATLCKAIAQVMAGQSDFAIGGSVESMSRVAMGSDYPFLLGETPPGSLIAGMPDLDPATRGRLLAGTALADDGRFAQAVIGRSRLELGDLQSPELQRAMLIGAGLQTLLLGLLWYALRDRLG